ncbi:hypothetical protein ISS04_02030 [Candidatus Woesearchaeota archaeon]|nr:hypothetical protein [Candidatus Woesearchaeota archaeon]
MVFGFGKLKRGLKKQEEYFFSKFRELGHINQMFASLTVFIGIILVWRGVYNIMNQYWFPDYPAFSNFSGIVVGLIILTLTHYIVKKAV